MGFVDTDKLLTFAFHIIGNTDAIPAIQMNEASRMMAKNKQQNKKPEVQWTLQPFNSR